MFPTPVDTGRKLNVHNTFRRSLRRLLNVLCTFSLGPVSTGTSFPALNCEVPAALGTPFPVNLRSTSFTVIGPHPGII